MRLSLLLLACHVIPVSNVSRKILSNSKLPFAPNPSLIWEAWTQPALSSSLCARWDPGALFASISRKQEMVYLFRWPGWVMDGLLLSSCELLDQPCPEASFVTRELLSSPWILSMGCGLVCSMEATGTVFHFFFFLTGWSSQVTALTLLLHHCVKGVSLVLCSNKLFIAHPRLSCMCKGDFQTSAKVVHKWIYILFTQKLNA